MNGTIIKADPGCFSLSFDPDTYDIIQIPIVAWNVIQNQYGTECHPVTPNIVNTGKHVVQLPDETVIDHVTSVIHDSIEDWMASVFIPAVLIMGGEEKQGVMSLADIDFLQQAEMMDAEEGMRLYEKNLDGAPATAVEFCHQIDATHIFDGQTTRLMNDKKVLCIKISSKGPQ